MNPHDKYYLSHSEPNRGCLLALREIILSQDQYITNEWKYGMPFFCYKGKMFCYLWIHKKFNQPYLGIVEGKRIEHAQLLLEKRARMKIMLIDPLKDLPIKSIHEILDIALSFYKKSIIKII